MTVTRSILLSLALSTAAVLLPEPPKVAPRKVFYFPVMGDCEDESFMMPGACHLITDQKRLAAMAREKAERSRFTFVFRSAEAAARAAQP